MNDLPTLTIIRGDTARFHFHRLDYLGRVITQKADKLFFTVKKKFTDKNFVIQKTIDDMFLDDFSEYHFRIDPKDTDGLAYGRYVYDLETIDSDGNKHTISRGYVELTYESTWANNEQ